MKQQTQSGYLSLSRLALAFRELPDLAALIVMLVITPHGLVYCDNQQSTSSASSSMSWNGSVLVDSAEGTSLHLRVSGENIAAAMSMIHTTAGTAGFPGFLDEAVEDLSIGLNFDSPMLVAGDLGLAGLGCFVFRPAGAGPLLPVHGHRPLQAERPDGARYRGLVLGNEGGLLAVYPRSDPARIASGAWFAPRGSPASVMLLTGSEPGKVSDDWYEPGSVQADRLWGAASLGMASKGKHHWMSLAGALAASAGLPGPDAWAGRMEAMLAIKRFRFEAEASQASEEWRAPDGATAMPALLDLSALYRYRGLELSGAYRLERRDAADEAPEIGIRGHFQLSNGKREFRLASTLSQAAGPSLPTVTLDTRWKPGLVPAVLPGLVAETSWRASDGQTERFDVGASLRGGSVLRWSMAAGLRYDSLGRHLKGAASILVPLGSGSMHFGLKSDGWIPLAGETPAAPLVLSLGMSFGGS